MGCTSRSLCSLPGDRCPSRVAHNNRRAAGQHMPTALGALQPLDVVEMGWSPQSRDDGPSPPATKSTVQGPSAMGQSHADAPAAAGHINTSPRDQGGSSLPSLRHRVAPQRLLGEGDALVEPRQDGVDSPVRVGIELTGGRLARGRGIQDAGEVVYRRGMAFPQRIPPEREQPEEHDPSRMTAWRRMLHHSHSGAGAASQNPTAPRLIRALRRDTTARCPPSPETA